ncbi:MAG: DUF2442 domain-containing protein [Candidatus Competibacteraceae bacterium]|jgi:hypothetical protein|nr:DUF2442 domain-containing protein [Candidatus Competibacteraceae bacterium]
MHPSVVKVVPCEDYVLSVVFDNGESGTLDMKSVLDFGVFKRLEDQATFRLSGSVSILSLGIPVLILTPNMFMRNAKSLVEHSKLFKQT